MCKIWQIIIIQTTVKPHQQVGKLKPDVGVKFAQDSPVSWSLRKKNWFHATFPGNELRAGV